MRLFRETVAAKCCVKRECVNAFVLSLLACASFSAAHAPAPLQIKVITLESAAPLVQVKVMVKAGSAMDPVGLEGLAYLTAQLMLQGAYGDPKAPVTKEKLAEITRPWGEGARPSVTVDKEVTTYSMTVPREVFGEFTEKVLRPLFTRPLFAAEELERLRQEALEYVGSTLRYENTEILGLLALDNYIHEGTAYAHITQGTVQGLKAVTRDAVERFYKTYYTPTNLVIGASTTDAAIVSLVQKALQSIGSGMPKVKPLVTRPLEQPKMFKGQHLVIVAQPATIATGLHAAFPIAVTRGSPDYWALYVANVFLGTHRDSFGRLYNDIRQARGYNYGDYSYIEWFLDRPRHLFPPPNTPRRYQYFSLWIRPVAHPYAHHILKAMTWELENFIRRGMTPQECESAKNKAKVLYLNLAENTSRLLAYKLDDQFYGMTDGGYLDAYLKQIDALTSEQINAAIKKHLQVENIKYVVVTSPEWAERLRDDIANNRNAKGKSFTDYNVEFRIADGDTLWQFTRSKLEIVQLDKVWEEYWLDIPPQNIRVVKAEQLFEGSRFIVEKGAERRSQ